MKRVRITERQLLSVSPFIDNDDARRRITEFARLEGISSVDSIEVSIVGGEQTIHLVGQEGGPYYHGDMD